MFDKYHFVHSLAKSLQHCLNWLWLLQPLWICLLLRQQNRFNSVSRWSSIWSSSLILSVVVPSALVIRYGFFGDLTSRHRLRASRGQRPNNLTSSLQRNHHSENTVSLWFLINHFNSISVVIIRISIRDIYDLLFATLYRLLPIV